MSVPLPWWGAIFVFAGFGISGAQPSKVIELRSARELNVKKIGDEEVRDFKGNVHFVQPAARGGTVKVWCDRAQQYMTQGRIELLGNVKIVRDEVTLTSTRGTYYSATRRAKIQDGVRLEQRGTVLTAREGDYFTDEKKAYFTGDVVVLDSASTTFSDALTYFEEGEKSIAVGNVKVVSPADGVTVFGDSLVHFGEINYTIVPKNPRLVQVDTSSTGGLDTLVVAGKVMEAYRDTSSRFIARDSVLMVRNELAARCGEAIYMPSEGLIVLLKQPLVWYAENQVSGDSIAVRLEKHKLRSVYVEGRAMAVSRSDSSLKSRFDQLTGRQLTLYFAKDNIEKIEAIRNATSLYYLFESERPNGLNRSSGDKITVYFTEGQVEEIKVVGGVEGQYMPEPMIDQREQKFNLDGFKWHGNRPKRRLTEISTE